jgi:hypothetical protein
MTVGADPRTRCHQDSSLSPISLPKLALKRLTDDRVLLASLLAGIIVATTLAAAGPVYLRSLERLGLNVAVEALVRPFSNISTIARRVSLTEFELRRTQDAMVEAIDNSISQLYESHEVYLRVETWFAGLPVDPLPPAGTTGEASRAYFRYLSNLQDHVTFTSGRMAADVTGLGREGPVLEAVVSVTTAIEFDLVVGQEVVVAPSLGSRTKITAQIVGVMEAIDPIEDYWHSHASVFIDPPPPEEAAPEDSELFYDPQRPPVPLFITERAMLDTLGGAYPGMLIESLWFIFTDTEPLKEWTVSEALGRFDDFEGEVTTAMPGAQVSTAITTMLENFDRRSFFTKVPLLLLTTVLVVTVLFFLVMMVSILVKRREEDASLFRTRGAGVVRLSRLYLLEGLAITAIAVAVAPFLATGLVAVAGFMPAFADLTEPGVLPVEIQPLPFIVAGATGLLCLIIYVVPGVLGTRGGLLAHKLRSSRPPSVPLLHRYFLDIAVLLVGGLIFWEMHSRGHVLSGGLFKQAEVNEALLFAPVLFLIAVALVFMRLFPLLVRYVSGESPQIVHLLATGSLAVLTPALAWREATGDWTISGFAPTGMLVALGTVYWAASRARDRRWVIVSLVVQAALVGGVVWRGPEVDHVAVKIAVAGTISIVPAQMAYLAIRLTAESLPVWLSIGLRHMARKPLQYTWLVLLLVLVTGAAVLTTTVGETLERSRSDRINYDIATDIRIIRLPSYMVTGPNDLRDPETGIPGLVASALAIRERASVGPFDVELLGLETRDFAYMSWYRDDFSDVPLGDVMTSLRSHPAVEKLPVPEEATSLGIWIKPADDYPNLSMWVVVGNETGAVRPVYMGKLGPPEWQLMSGEITRASPPLHIVAVQIYEPGFGAVGTPGTISVDDIHMPTADGGELVLEDFEGELRWTPIVTSPVSSDRLVLTSRDAHGGNTAAQFSFGKENQRGIRGFYQSPTAGPLPVVISAKLAANTGAVRGDSLFVELREHRVEVTVTDIVRHFPTLNPDGERFIIADLDRLLAHLNILSPSRPYRPNELFITADSTAGVEFDLALGAIRRVSGRVLNRTDALSAVARDPLTTAGWRSISLLALGILVLTAGLGYMTYMVASAGHSRSEIAFLRSLGLSPRQLLGLMGFEHISIAVIGLGLGTWAGFQMSRLMVSVVAIDEKGDDVVPPFVLTTDWVQMLTTYVVLLSIFAATVLLMNCSVNRREIHTIARSEAT